MQSIITFHMEMLLVKFVKNSIIEFLIFNLHLTIGMDFVLFFAA